MVTLSNKNDIPKRRSFEEINHLAKVDPQELIGEAEASFKFTLNETASKILNGQKKCKLVMVSGPSSSGKTTFSNMICEQLIKNGVWAGILSLDNFYKGVKKVPLLEDGTKDFESIEGLDTDKIQQCLLDLINTGSSVIPTYDFSTMAPSSETEQIELPEDGIMLIEGLHAISPYITKGFDPENIINIYVDIRGGIKRDDSVFFPSRFIRLMRRVQRDYRYRYTLPVRTMLMWKNIYRGEKLYIRPLRSFADIKINTLHDYEPCVMGKEVLQLMNSVPDNIDVSKFIERLSQFNFIDESLVPQDSLIREFI